MMDTSRWFRDLVACRKYPTFNAFQQCLRAFQEFSSLPVNCLYRTPKIGCNSIIVLRAENNLLRVVRFDMRHCHVVGREYVECLPMPPRKCLKSLEPNHPLENSSSVGSAPDEPLVPRSRSSLTREEKFEIISPHLNHLADFVCNRDDVHFYRTLEVIQSIYEDWDDLPSRQRLIALDPQEHSNNSLSGGRIDVVSA
ncbi:unnamed protein product [Mesocestoides corti]|uniref:Uncharacterized protein n=1 Tax=Mesocestoides corti TaxID=53468 RepID=A0A0R3U1K3_MESCO|nr:unnamed protein product [Mesocestoides corti]